MTTLNKVKSYLLANLTNSSRSSIKDPKNPRKDPVDPYQGYLQDLDKILEDREETVAKIFARSFKKLL